MIRFMLASMAMVASMGTASAQTYYMRAHLEGVAVDTHSYRWTQPISDRGTCVAGFKTVRYENQCYDDTAQVVVADAKCTAMPPAPRTDRYACTMKCTNPLTNKKSSEAGDALGTATSASNAAVLCRKVPAQAGICYWNSTTKQTTFTYTDAAPIASTKAEDYATYCAAQDVGFPL